jgi:hypothetical protein
MIVSGVSFCFGASHFLSAGTASALRPLGVEPFKREQKG